MFGGVPESLVGEHYRAATREKSCKNTSKRRRARSPARRPASSPAVESRLIARCTVRRSGAARPPAFSASTGSRCNAATFRVNTPTAPATARRCRTVHAAQEQPAIAAPAATATPCARRPPASAPYAPTTHWSTAHAHPTEPADPSSPGEARAHVPRPPAQPPNPQRLAPEQHEHPSPTAGRYSITNQIAGRPDSLTTGGLSTSLRNQERRRSPCPFPGPRSPAPCTRVRPAPRCCPVPAAGRACGGSARERRKSGPGPCCDARWD